MERIGKIFKKITNPALLKKSDIPEKNADDFSYVYHPGVSLEIHNKVNNSAWTVYKDGLAIISSTAKYTNIKECAQYEWTKIMESLPHSENAKRVHIAIADWMKRNNHPIPEEFDFIRHSELKDKTPMNGIKQIGGTKTLGL